MVQGWVQLYFFQTGIQYRRLQHYCGGVPDFTESKTVFQACDRPAGGICLIGSGTGRRTGRRIRNRTGRRTGSGKEKGNCRRCERLKFLVRRGGQRGTDPLPAEMRSQDSPFLHQCKNLSGTCTAADNRFHATIHTGFCFQHPVLWHMVNVS